MGANAREEDILFSLLYGYGVGPISDKGGNRRAPVRWPRNRFLKPGSSIFDHRRGRGNTPCCVTWGLTGCVSCEEGPGGDVLCSPRTRMRRQLLPFFFKCLHTKEASRRQMSETGLGHCWPILRLSLQIPSRRQPDSFFFASSIDFSPLFCSIFCRASFSLKHYQLNRLGVTNSVL